MVAPVTPPPPKPKPHQARDLRHARRDAEVAEGGRQEAEDHREGDRRWQGSEGRQVTFTGTGIKKIGKTNAKGIVTFTVRPTRSGIIRVEIRGSKACNTQRIGVVGVFEPPVTG